MLVNGAAVLRPGQRGGEHGLHGCVVEDNTPQYSNVPDVVAAAEVVEDAGAPALGALGGVQHGSGDVHDEALGDGRVKVQRPLRAASVGELEEWDEACQREGAVERNAHPGHVGAVEGRLPRQDDTANAQGGREYHV